MFKQLLKNIENAYYNLSPKAESKAVRELNVALNKEFSTFNSYVGTESLIYISKNELGARVEFRFKGIPSDIIIEANIKYDRKSQSIQLVDKTIEDINEEYSLKLQKQKEKNILKVG